MEFEIRRAEPKDCAMLWRWRNDPVTRRAQRLEDPIPWDAYESWYARALASPGRVILIASPADPSAGEDLGVAQFTLGRVPEMAEIGLNLNPAWRGRGLAAPLIERFCAEGRRHLGFGAVIAHVKAENLPSRRAFIRAGFALDDAEGGILRFRRDFP